MSIKEQSFVMAAIDVKLKDDKKHAKEAKRKNRRR